MVRDNNKLVVFVFQEAGIKKKPSYFSVQFAVPFQDNVFPPVEVLHAVKQGIDGDNKPGSIFYNFFCLLRYGVKLLLPFLFVSRQPEANRFEINIKGKRRYYERQVKHAHVLSAALEDVPDEIHLYIFTLDDIAVFNKAIVLVFIRRFTAEHTAPHRR